MSNNLNELGVGLVYFQGFENFLASHASLIDVVEIEPQTFWYDKNNACDAFKYDPEVTDFLRAYDKPKLFHGVGYPVGGTILPPPQQFNTLRQQCNELKPEWVSEHLSFNMFSDAGREINSGFLLPPIQSKEGVKTAVDNIRHYKAEMNMPFAFETGVNYLQPRKNEISDGLFARSVAEEADCHILLDLHNILTNQRNGRQSVKDFLAELPLERVIELHMGGGIYYKDFYLDAHSGASDAELFGILEEIVGKLPNLKALMFEINPDYFIKTSESAIRNQLQQMKRIWDKKGSYNRNGPLQKAKYIEPVCDESISVEEWEETMGKLVLGKHPDTLLGEELFRDKGISIIKDLVFNFRGSVLISVLKYSTRLLRLSVGEKAFNKGVDDFFESALPELLPVVMAEQFSCFIRSNKIAVPYLDKILEYEIASIHTAIDKKNRMVSFDFDPSVVLIALENALLPARQLEKKTVNLQIVFDKPTADPELLNFQPVFHN